MSVQKILPIARKMGEKNFLAYKEFVKNAKTLKAGESIQTNLLLKGITIVDTIDVTPRVKSKVDEKGMKNLLREIFKKYFPRTADEETNKSVTLAFTKRSEDSSSTLVETYTNDKDSEGIGYSCYKFIKKGKEIFVDIENRCEDFALYLKAKLNLKNVNMKQNQKLNVGINSYRDIQITEKGDDVLFSLKTIPNEDVQEFNLEASISKEKFESMFGGELENSLPELIEKSGFKML